MHTQVRHSIVVLNRAHYYKLLLLLFAYITFCFIEKPRFDDADKTRIRKDKKHSPPPQGFENSIYLSEVVVLLHTVKEEELLAVYDHLQPPTEETDKLITIYQGGPSTAISLTLGKFANHKVAVIQTRKGRDCSSEIQYALQSLPNLKLIIGVGFCYGRREKCALGDVLVSTNVDGVSNLRNENDQLKIDEGMVRYTNMNTATENVFARRTWFEFNCVKNGDRNSEVHPGVVLSSPMLLNSRKALDDFLKCDGRFIGGEMEGQELAQCTRTLRERDGRTVDFIIIKGVGDFGDGTKEKSWQLTASKAAVTYAEEKLNFTQGSVYNIPGAYFILC